jgi:undecaprenyl-diphosphatase
VRLRIQGGAVETTRIERVTRRPQDAVIVVVGAIVLAAGMILVRDGDVSRFERSVFRKINDLPGALYPVLWPFQQLGSLFMGAVVAVIATLLRRYRLAIAAILVTLAKLATERSVKVIVSRSRPGTSIGPDVHMRGAVHAIGEAFVSGHGVLAAGLAGVITPYLPGAWKVAPWVVVLLVMFTRVYVGAHNPLDVVCGVALGLVIAGVVNLALGVPDGREVR